MLLPQVQGLRSCARMLTLEARVAAHRGDADGTARSIHAMFAACRAVEEDPILISHLVRVALVVTAIETVLAEEKLRTRDLGGSADTVTCSKAIAEALQ